MWNCSTVLTRHGSLYNSTVGLTTRNNFLQRNVALTLKKRLFKTDVIQIGEHSCTGKVRNCNLDRILTAPHSQTIKNAKAARICVKDLSIRQFHTSLKVRRAVDNDVVQSESLAKVTDNINLDKSFDLHENTSDRVPFSHIPQKLRNREDFESTPGTHEYHHHHHHHHKLHPLSLKDIERKYPNPKQKLHEIYVMVKNAKKTEVMNYDFSRETQSSPWDCTLTVYWPEKTSFTAKSVNKNGGASSVALKCLYWLETTGRLHKGLPKIHSREEISDLMNQPVPLSVQKSTLNAARLILEKYEDNIEPIIQSHDNTLHIEQPRFSEGAIIDPVGISNPILREESRMERRNEMLKLRYESRVANHQPVDLPISEYREEIIKAVENNNVLVIKGDTGCGKTTQVPQYIMDSFAAKGRATDCNMIVAQPRRISAISLAERVADERREQVGDVIGYQVRLAHKLPNTPAGIQFCTTGILLRKLQFNPTLEGCSHVILDEAHERKIDTDVLLVLLKRAIEKRPSLKVIIMSATINADLFQNYFSCGVINVPGRLYPVQMNFMEDIDRLGLRSPSRYDLTFEDANKDSGPVTDIVKMGELISYIARNKSPGGILCFLPGWAEITKMKNYLEDYSFLSKNEIMVVPVHSKMSHFDQRKIFQKPPPHVRKIVLATDIAETGITVADVVYVVDSCIHRDFQWNEQRGYASLENNWASQANINQRKGRAGRVQPGISYHFINRDKFSQLPEYPIPEVMRSSLAKTVLDAKTYSPERAANFLGSMPQPPSPGAIRHAVEHLVNLGAFDYEENLTPLGKRIAYFALTPELSKAIVYSSIFNCVSPMITIASLMSGESEIFAGVLHQKTDIRNVKSVFHPTSDHVSLAWLFQQWYGICKQSNIEARQFAMRSQLVHEKMFTISKVRQINAEHLYHANMLPDTEMIDDMSAKENEFAELDELCRGVLLAGLDHILYRRDVDMRKGQLKQGIETFVMEDGGRASITPDSVNFKRKQWPSPYLTYVRRTHSEERRTSLIRESSIISPLTVFLFSQARVSGYLHNKQQDNEEVNGESEILFTMKDRKNVNLVCDKDTADVLISFRDTMWAVVRYLVANHGVKTTKTEDLDQVQTFKSEMLNILGKMLSEASGSIDHPNPPQSNSTHETAKNK